MLTLVPHPSLQAACTTIHGAESLPCRLLCWYRATAPGSSLVVSRTALLHQRPAHLRREKLLPCGKYNTAHGRRVQEAGTNSFLHHQVLAKCLGFIPCWRAEEPSVPSVLLSCHSEQNDVSTAARELLLNASSYSVDYFFCLTHK